MIREAEGQKLSNIGFYVLIKDFGFSPSAMTLLAGDWITFENIGSNMYKLLVGKDSQELLPGQIYQYKFPKPGEYQVTCENFKNMFFDVVVKSQKDYGAY